MIALVTGAASSGKSAYAEELAERLRANAGRSHSVVYLATMEPWGSEAARRIERHRAMREGKGFITLEAPRNLGEHIRTAVAQGIVTSESTVLLEDLGNLVANEMYPSADTIAPANQVKDAVLAGIAAITSTCKNMIVVGNEIGADGADLGSETRTYQETLGACACAIAAEANLVVEVVAGCPNILKGERP